MSVNEKMTALANEIRELSGTTATKGLDAMISDVSAANTEIVEQTNLLGQIVTALENKTAGGSGSGGNYQISIGTVEYEGAIVVEDLPFTPKYVALFSCQSFEGVLGSPIGCSEFGTFDGVNYSSQTSFNGHMTGGSTGSTGASEIEITDNGFMLISFVDELVGTYRYIAIG